MAYNPFSIFRRNQKALFAVLTVFIMFMFTLSSGVAGGDFFETFTRWMGAKGSKEEVCKIDGHRVTAAELEGGTRSLQFRRFMANKFMYYAARQTAGDILLHANSQRERLSPAGKEMADAARRALEAINQVNSPQLRGNPQIAEILLPRLIEQIKLGQQRVDDAIESPAYRSEDKDVARAYRTAFNLNRYLQDGQGEHYFMNAPNRTRRDLVEFMLWERKADQLGIRFSTDDVKKLIQNDFYSFFKSDVKVRELLQQTQGFSMDACLSALASEFKVRAAQTAVLGNAGRYHSAPALTTPYEMFEFYRDKTSPAEYEVLAVPAAAFVDQVTGEPTDAEVLDLFKKYQDAEPNPKSETPGFKEPRKIAVGWLGITGDEPYYKALAAEQIKVGEVLAKASGALAVPLPGLVGTWTAGMVAPLGLKEPAVDAAYARYASSFRTEVAFKYESERAASGLRTRDLLESSTVKAGAVAAVLGGFAGHPMAGVANAVSAPIAYEVRDRVRVGLPVVVGLFPGPGVLQTAAAGAAAGRANEPKPLPIEALRPELLKTTADERAKVLAFGGAAEKGDLARFMEELTKLSENDRPKDRAAVEKYIKEFVAARGLTQVGASTAPRDEWTLEDDPGLAPLVAAHRMSVELAKTMKVHGGQEPYSPFGRSFFWTTNPRTGRPEATRGTFLGDPYPVQDRSAADLGRSRFVVWRTEDVASKKMNLQTAKTAVVAGWKRLKARELALAHANGLAEKMRTLPESDPQLLHLTLNQMQFNLRDLAARDPKAAARARKFTVKNVAPLIPGPPSPLGGAGQLQPFGLTDSEDIPYPTVDMVTALVDNRDKGAKTVLVLPDAAKDTFYVATLLDRRLKGPGEFTQEVVSPRGGAKAVVNLFREDAMNKARQSVVELLKQEFKYEETDDQKKKMDENAKSGRNAD